MIKGILCGLLCLTDNNLKTNNLDNNKNENNNNQLEKLNKQVYKFIIYYADGSINYS